MVCELALQLCDARLGLNPSLHGYGHLLALSSRVHLQQRAQVAVGRDQSGACITRGVLAGWSI